MLPVQTSSFCSLRSSQCYLCWSRQNYYASESAKDAFLIVECLIPRTRTSFHFRISFETIISNDPGSKLLLCEFHLNGRHRAVERQGNRRDPEQPRHSDWPPHRSRYTKVSFTSGPPAFAALRTRTRR